MIMQHSVMIETSFIMDSETEIRENKRYHHVFYVFSRITNVYYEVVALFTININNIMK